MQDNEGNRRETQQEQIRRNERGEGKLNNAWRTRDYHNKTGNTEDKTIRETKPEPQRINTRIRNS